MVQKETAKIAILLFIPCFNCFCPDGISCKICHPANVKVYEVDFETQADLKVFRVDFQNQATDCSGLWFYTDLVNQAQWKIYFTDFETQADLKIFYVKFRNQAGWRNEEKKALYCN